MHIKNLCYALILAFAFVFLISCHTNTFSSEKELIDYMQDEANGYKQSKTVNGIDFTLVYRPTDLLVHQELGDSSSKDKIEALRNKYNNYLYFNLSMSKNNQELLSTAPKNQNEFGAMVNQLAFGMREKVHLFTQSKDTIEMSDFIYPRMYGMSKSTTIMFVYPREKDRLKSEFLNFTIEDLGLYTGEVKFKIDTKKIKSEPQIAFKK
jgi:hypothetical protein